MLARKNIWIDATRCYQTPAHTRDHLSCFFRDCSFPCTHHRHAHTGPYRRRRKRRDSCGNSGAIGQFWVILKWIYQSDHFQVMEKQIPQNSAFDARWIYPSAKFCKLNGVGHWSLMKFSLQTPFLVVFWGAISNVTVVFGQDVFVGPMKTIWNHSIPYRTVY